MSFEDTEEPMRKSGNTWLQTAAAITLFCGSFGILLYNTFTAGSWPQRERALQTRLEEVTHGMADAAHSVLRQSVNREEFDRLLSDITNRVLENTSDVEGGFYLKGTDRFGGYGFPTSRLHHPLNSSRTDPPPLEAPLIRAQAQRSLLEHHTLVTVREVGPSRVMVATTVVGQEQDVEIAVWTMMRLSGPEQLQTQLRNYQLSVGLALAGLALALVMMWTLSRSLVQQRQAEAHLRDELRRAEQLATLGRLLAGVAHEIRNPLAAIRSTLQLWQRQPNPATMEGAIETVLQETERMNGVLTRLLQFVRADHTERQAIDMNSVIANTMKLFEAQAATQNILLTLELAPELPAVSGSEAAIRQVLQNLVTNAFQAMPNGGRLLCRTLWVPDGIEIDIVDTGPGILDQDRPHLFEPFFTTRTDGTGLGLALCREILGQHGGTIALKTDTERGATFTLVFPTKER
jgi:signal transduction histidine kinase